MPLQNLEYTIVHATGWDEGYPPQQLLPKDKNTADCNKNTNNNNNNSNVISIKHGKGWQSEKFCSYPQEIILQVTCGPARIRKLQILSHHYKIASKLEIYVGSVQRRKEVVGGMTNNINNDNINDDDSVKSANAKRAISWDKMPKIIEDDGMSSDEEDAIDDDDGDNNDHHQSQDDNKTKNNQNTTNYDPITMNGEPYIHFRRLGYCALDSNERAHYKAREFKSVRLDAEGEYIRLVARKCHSNHLNKHNQVGLVGITVMGEPADYLLAGESRKIPIENTDDGLSRVESPEICTVPIIQENFYHPYDQRNFASLYSLLPGNNNNNNNGNDNHVDDNGKHTNSSSLVINNVTNTFTSLLIENSTSSSSPSSPSSTSPTDAISTTSFSSSSSFSNNNEQSEIATIAPIKRKLKDYLTANDFLQNENDTTRLLSAFNKAKKNAVDVEDFRLAKVLKYSVDLMKRGVEEVARIDVLKREAVKEEDFDNADKCKQDIEAIRGDVRAALSDEGLDIDDQDEVVIYDPQLDPELQDIIGLADDDGDGSNTNNNNNNNNDDDNNNKNDDDNDKKNGIGGNNNNNNNNNAGQMTNQCHYHSSWMSQQQSNLQQQLQITDYIEEEPEELSTLARSAFALPIQYFGDFLIASLLSKKFVLRELALTEIEKRIDYHISSDNHHNRSDGDEDDVLSDKLALIKASYQVIQEGLNNHLQEKLLISTFSLWQKTIDYSIHNQVPISSTYKLAEQTYNSLFSKITESDAATETASTIKHASLDLLVSLVRTYQDSKCSLLNNFVLKPAKTSSQPSKQAKAKLESVLRLIDEFGVSTLPREKLKLHYQHQHQLQDQEEHSVVVKMCYEHLMDFSLSYLNNNHSDVREMAVKLTFEVIKRVGKQYVEPYLVVGNNSKNIKHQDVIQDVWRLVTEYERDNGEIVQRIPTPDPAAIIVKKHSGNNEIKETTADKNSALYSDVPDLTEEERRELAELEEEQERMEREKLENFEIDQTLLSKPLAKRGTITRVEQQLMELRSMMNNTNNIIKEDYDTYLANSMNPPYHREEEDGDDCGEEEVKVQTTQSKPSSSSSKKPGGSSGRNAAKPSSSSNKNSDKVKKSSGNQPSGKKTSATAKNVKGNATANNKSSRRGSTDDAKTAGGPKGSKKSLNKNLDADSLCDGTDKTKEVHSDRFCIFCDEQNDDFTEENLVVHYWNECPILTKCRLCNIILEISTLDEHMLKDCDKSKFVKQCQRCREIIEADDYLEHIAKQSCMTIRPDIVRCPLCKTVIKPATEAGWKDHLLNIDGCPRNRRKIKSSDEHVNDADGGVAVSPDAVKETSAATKKRSKTSGDSPKSATTKSSGSATNRKTASAVGATSTAGKVKKTASSTTKVSKAKK